MNSKTNRSLIAAVGSLCSKEGLLRADVEWRQVKCLNNGIESDHAPIKKLTVATGGFKIRKRAWSMLQGFESLRMINKGQFDLWLRNGEHKILVWERIRLHESSLQC